MIYWNRLMACSAASIGMLIVMIYSQLDCSYGVIVDGTRKGPSALENQSHEAEMIDRYNAVGCGIADPDTNKSDFVNAAREGQFPWLVSMQIEKDSGRPSHFCMGSFISETWILSAAHCFADPRMRKLLADKKIRIVAGSVDAYSKNDTKLTPKSIYYHSKFNLSSPVGFDVALVEINEHVKMKIKNDGQLPFINTVCLPIEGKKYAEGQVVKLAGWGDTESKDPNSKPDRLLTTDLVLTNAEQCANIFSNRLKKVKDQYHNYKDFICADYHGQRDACQGDSGSALLEYADDKAVNVGIVSYGLGCATKGVPGIYTRTSAFMPWIKDITLHRRKANVQFTVLSSSDQ